MTTISENVRKTVDEIKELADGDIDDQLKANKKLSNKFSKNCLRTNVDSSLIPEFLPIIKIFLQSDNHILQRDGAKYIDSITGTPDKKQNTKLVVDAGIIPELYILLSSTDNATFLNSLRALVSIAYYFPENVLKNGVIRLFISYLNSENEEIRKQAACFMCFISSQFCIGALLDGVEPLLKLLDSQNNDTLEATLMALINISRFNFETCRRVIQLDALKCMKKLCDNLFGQSQRIHWRRQKYLVLTLEFILVATSYKDEDQTDVVINEGFVQLIVEQINNEKNCELQDKSIETITNIVATKPSLLSSLIHDYNIFSFKVDDSTLPVKELIKYRDIKLIRHVTSCGETQVDAIINEGCIPLILQQINDGTTPEIKIEAIKTIENIIYFKSEVWSTLINEQTLMLLYYNNLGSINGDLVITVLNALKNILEMFDDKGICREKIKKCDNQESRLQNLFKDENEEICQLSHLVYEFVNVIQPAPPVFAAMNDENELIELDDEAENAIPVAESPRPRQHRKRRTYAQDGPLKSNKRFRISNEETDTERSASPFNDHDINFDLDDNSVSVAAVESTRQSERSVTPVNDENDDRDYENYSPVSPTDVALAASRNSSITRNYSLANSGTTENADEMKPDNFIPLKFSSFDDLDNPSTPLFPVLPRAASTNNDETIVNNNLQSAFASPVYPPTPDELSNANNFPSLKYWRHEYLISECCQKLGIEFEEDMYRKFIGRLHFKVIAPALMPDQCFVPADQSGFGCFSLLLTGKEGSAKKIKEKINEEYNRDLILADKFDAKTITKVINSPNILDEHFETIATWLKCRIMVYSFNQWVTFGDFEDASTPLFVLSQTLIKENPSFQIVLSLKNDE